MTRPRSLQARLVLRVVGLVAVLWAGAAAVTVVDTRHELAELLDAHLAQAASLLVAQNLCELDEDDEVVDAPPLHRYAPRAVFQVWHEGMLVMRSANAPATRLAAPGEFAADGFATARRADGTWRIFAARGAEADVEVFVGERLEARNAILVAVLRGMLLPLAVALPLLAIGGFWAVRRGLAPLRALGVQLAARRPQALEPVQLAEAPAEMLPMVDALNGLFLRIAALIEGERRFTADAAHELRTPIAAIRTQAQVALGATDDAQRRHALGATLAGCDRATRLVDQLLTLARLESGGAAQAGSVDLAALLREVVASVTAAARLKDQALDLEAPTACAVAGDEVLLAVLLRNLVDNALRYTPAGGRIAVTLAAGDRDAALTVDDSGPGLADADQARLGERFFRVPGHAASGSGLGWSICTRIAALHRAALRAERSPVLGGLRASVRLPLSAGTAPAA